MALAALPLFNQLTGETLSLSVFGPLELFITIFGLLLVVGFIAGGYPSMLLAQVSAHSCSQRRVHRAE